MNWQELALQHRLFTAPVGSRARGLGQAGSDYDLRSVYMLPRRYSFLLDGSPPDEVKVVSDDGTLDHVSYDLMKFMRSLYKPSPENIETLWVEPQQVNRQGMILRQMRHKLSSKALVKRMVAASGQVETAAVLDYLQSGDTAKVGRSHMLGRALFYRDTPDNRLAMKQIDEKEARKAITDSVRRLIVAYHMMLPYASQADHYDPMGKWLMILTEQLREQQPLSWWEDEDGAFMVDMGEYVPMLRSFRYGDVNWETMLMTRNAWYEQVQQMLLETKLRDVADPRWGQLYLDQLLAEQ